MIRPQRKGKEWYLQAVSFCRSARVCGSMMRTASENGRDKVLAGGGRMGMPLRLVLVLLLFIVAITTILSSLKAMLFEIDPLAHEFPQIVELTLESSNARRSTKLKAGRADFDDALRLELPSSPLKEIFSCDRSHPRTDVCTMKGDVRMDGQSGSFILYSSSPNIPIEEESIKPYTRKWEKSCMDMIHEVKLKRIGPANAAQKSPPLICDIHHAVPAVVFTTGGYTGNLYHEFHDGLIPLYITSQHLKKEVVFVIVEFHNWWLMKYGDVINQLSSYPVVDFEKETRIHCFPEVTVGLHIHEELGINPSLMLGNETIQDFRAVLDQAYTDPSALTALLPVLKKPRLVIIVRDGTRIFQNVDQIVALAEDLGYNVTLWKPDPTTDLKQLYWTLNSSEVLMGVHGAAMTHFLFMRPGSIFIQIVPLGTKWAASTYYGDPAKKLGLQYVEYIITPEESSLIDHYDKNDTVLTNPEVLVKKSWWEMKQIYLEHQDVRPSLIRLRKTLIKAKSKALRFMKLKDSGL